MGSDRCQAGLGRVDCPRTRADLWAPSREQGWTEGQEGMCSPSLASPTRFLVLAGMRSADPHHTHTPQTGPQREGQRED